MSAKDLIGATKVVFVEPDLPKTLVSGAGTNSDPEQFKDFCKCLNKDHILTLWYHLQSNGHVEA